MQVIKCPEITEIIPKRFFPSCVNYHLVQQWRLRRTLQSRRESERMREVAGNEADLCISDDRLLRQRTAASKWSSSSSSADDAATKFDYGEPASLGMERRTAAAYGGNSLA